MSDEQELWINDRRATGTEATLWQLAAGKSARVAELEQALAAAQATIEAVKTAAESFQIGTEVTDAIDAVLSRVDGAALEQVKADAFDEGLAAEADHGRMPSLYPAPDIPYRSDAILAAPEKEGEQ